MPARLLRRLPFLSRISKRAILVGYDLLAMILALWAAFSTRLGVFYLPENAGVLGSAAASFAVGIFALYRLQVYRVVLRYFDLSTVSRILAGAATAAAAWVIIVYFGQVRITSNGLPILVPRSVAFIYCGFLFLLLFMGRYVMAILLAGATRDQGPTPDARSNVVIYGANPAGISLAHSMVRGSQFQLKGFIDDDSALHGQIVAGAPVYPPEMLPELARKAELTEVFLALPNATRSERLAAIARGRELKLSVKTIPAPEEIVSGRFTISDVRPIEVGDLLRRDPVEPLSDLIRIAAEGHNILITGAGGSIGSEICRQIVRARPKKLVLLDHSEFALYSIHEQLSETLNKLSEAEQPEVVPVVGSMLNESLVRELLARHDINTIYHAAAYKHVPLLEDNEVVGVENNVIGTLAVARAAFDARLTRFTMISTDKAVRPTSVMGASKRLAELIIQALAEQPECRTRFGIVRFGNVLDSSGSVVQRFRKQISAGGPVTVTHKDVVRFFMSIPEATQLVLQASAMARNGEVFVLDMGEPIKIADLARQMITLSGFTVRDELNPNGEIEIKYVGLRPGEKLYEELFVGEETLQTSHPRIRMASERPLSFDELQSRIDELTNAVKLGSPAAVRRVLDAIVRSEGGCVERPKSKVALLADWRR